VEPDRIVTHIDVWYDRDSFQTWVVTQYNKTGDQVGESIFQHHKQDAVSTAITLQIGFGGVEKVSLSISRRDGTYPQQKQPK
jgi:hypothetical protein